MGFIDDLRAYVRDALGVDDLHITTTGLTDEQEQVVSDTYYLLLPMPGTDAAGGDIQYLRVHARVVAEKYEDSRAAFTNLARIMLRYPEGTPQSVSQSDAFYQFPGGVTKPSTGADFLYAVEVGIAV